jgi:hypothetical protein
MRLMFLGRPMYSEASVLTLCLSLSTLEAIQGGALGWPDSALTGMPRLNFTTPYIHLN